MRSHVLGFAALVGALASGPLTAQGPPELTIERADGATRVRALDLEQGFAAVPIGLFEELGWAVAEVEGAIAMLGPHGITLALTVGSPFFTWDDEVLQLADVPYRGGGQARVPIQLLADFLPRRLPELYTFDGSTLTLQAAEAEDWSGTTVVQLRPDAQEPDAQEPDAEDPAGQDSDAQLPSASTAAGAGGGGGAAVGPGTADRYRGPRIVVVDAGHGGGDPGALGLRGIREKNVALGIARAIAELLEREPDFEVYLTREDDTFVPIWDRGDLATEWKGDRPGVFLSIHANSFPTRRSARGFETYFLAEARNDHERRVSAIENAPLSAGGQAVDPDEEPDLGFILRELKTLDHQHWSAMLAEMVQAEMAKFHPGPDRGVKQGVLAVLTNALMPSVLVEVGYLSNEDEGPLLGQPTFQDEAARSIARAVVRFFERYPPGSGTEGPGGGV
ncbi:MAG TPA: N-acetylmuramoyl-L-alanine amidase [Gemmatimonadetes bacterium]|nr:N-acetylmuramoyl-L-alanine amidase [Gemmatimonadota bacterium]